MLRVLYDVVVVVANAGLACERSFPLWMRAVSAIMAFLCLICALGDAGLLGAWWAQ